jgi:hypothetical protein
MNKLFSVLALAASMYAADITGKWTGKMETPNGSRDVNMAFKADGAALTGSVSGRNGDTPIENGKIDGDSIKLNYKMRDNDVVLTLKRAN